jgi:predicted CoA-binding protein
LEGAVVGNVPQSVGQFLQGKHIAVAGVSRHSDQPANAIYRRLRDSGFEVFPVNPNAGQVEGVACYPNLASIPVPIDGVVVVTHPDVSIDVVRECSELGIRRVWFHRSIGEGSVSEDAVRECESRDINCIIGGCPLMFCEPVDIGHKCMKWWYQRKGKVPR